MLELSELNICFLAGTLGQGGAERQLYYMLRGLRENGANPRLITLTRGEFWEKRISELDIPITWIGEPQSRLRRLLNLVKALRKDPPQVLQSQHFYTNLYAAAAARALKIREIAALRNDGVNEVRVNGLLLGRMSLRLPRLVVANSRAAIRNAIGMGVPGRRLRFLPNVVDTQLFKMTERPARAQVTIVAAGRLVEEKRIDRFLRIVNDVRGRARLPIKALIVGDGPLRSQLEAQASAMGLLPGIVEFKGAASEMTSVYRDADVLVLTSDQEGTPNVVLEAMASGLPVVAARVGGVDEIVRPGETGELADARDEGALTRVLVELVNNPELRMRWGSGGRAFVEANHCRERLPSHLAEIYRAALK